MIQQYRMFQAAKPLTQESIVQRERLFHLLDQSRKKPAVWISAPGGSGKTTLAGTYLNSRNIPYLWYQLDEKDADPAAFFYHLGAAFQEQSSGKKKTLPVLTPEYLAGIKTFAKCYFEQLFQSLPSPAMLVLDNYQDVSPYAPIHEFITGIIPIIPKEITLIFLSRNEPHPIFNIHENAEVFSAIGWQDIRFSFEETREFARMKSDNNIDLDTESLLRLYTKTDGWIMGLLLILQSLKNNAAFYQLLDNLTLDEVFDYFASEIFNISDRETQCFLLKTAFAPQLTASMAAKLTGSHSAERFLSRLSRNQLFTIHYSQTGSSYQYHPLFRDFLLNRAKATLTVEEADRIRRKTALLMEEVGRKEDAANLFIEASDWQGLSALIVKNALSMLAEGRSKTLMEWLTGLPGDVLQKDAWLLYWLGSCLLMVNPAEARQNFIAAYEIFKDNDAAAGLYLTWSNIVDTYIYEWKDFHPLDNWIKELEMIRLRQKNYPSQEIADRVACCMFSALMFRRPDHPEMPAWQEKAEEIVKSSNNTEQRLKIGHNLVFYNLWMGRIDTASVILDILSPLFRKKVRYSLAQMMSFTVEALYYFYVADYRKGLDTVIEGLALSKKTGIHFMDMMLYSRGIYNCLAGNLLTAETYLRTMESIKNTNSCFENIYFHHMASLVILNQGDIPLAIMHAEACYSQSKGEGVPLVAGIYQFALSCILLRAAKYDEVKHHLIELQQITMLTKSLLLELCVEVLKTFLFMQAADKEKITYHITNVINLHKKTGCKTIIFHGLTNNALLCTKALELGIEVEFVQELIRLHKLTPDSEHLHLENWPWEIKICTLGSFELLKNDKPITFSGKAQKKPLELLKAIVAMGCENISEDILIDTLWPEADGDLAYRSFGITLHRLRKLIGNDKVIQRQSGKVSLNKSYCWVDIQAFEHKYLEIESQWKQSNLEENEGTITLVEKVAQLYAGNFLPTDMDKLWSVPTRDRLQKMFLSIVRETGNYYEKKNQWSAAIEWYSRGIEVDNLAENLYQNMMLCYKKLGMKAEAVKVYWQCHSNFLKHLNIAPSNRTEEIYQAIER